MMTALALDEMARGRQIFSNYSLRGAQLFGPDDLLHLPPGLVLIDEAHLYFPARGAMRLPPSWLQMMSQTRKRGWDIWYTTQHEHRIDSVVKDVTNWLWKVEAWSVPMVPKFFVSKAWEPEQFRRKGLHYQTRLKFFSEKTASAYDTFETIQVAEHAQSKTDHYATKGSTP